MCCCCFVMQSDCCNNSEEPRRPLPAAGQTRRRWNAGRVRCKNTPKCTFRILFTSAVALSFIYCIDWWIPHLLRFFWVAVCVSTILFLHMHDSFQFSSAKENIDRCKSSDCVCCLSTCSMHSWFIGFRCWLSSNYSNISAFVSSAVLYLMMFTLLLGYSLPSVF